MSDTSSQDARPIWLYRFTRNSKVWRITSDKQDYVADDGTYLAVLGGISCGDIESSQDHIRNNPVADVGRENEIAELFRVQAPTDVIGVNIREVHRGEADYVVRFVGTVSGCKWDGVKASLQFVSIVDSMNAPALKLVCALNCQAVLFGPGCNLNRSYFEHYPTITAIDGNTVTVSSVDPALPYQGGEITVEDGDGNLERRMIDLQDENDPTILTLARRFSSNIIVTDASVIVPGCDHRITGHCSTVYDNTDNYRGQPHFAGQNPMGGKAVY